MKFSKLGLLFLILTGSFISESSYAEFVPNIRYFSNKLVDAWNNEHYSDDINDLPDEGDLLIDKGRLKKIDFERVATWGPNQIEFALKAHKYLLETGIDMDHGPFRRGLGAVGILVGYEYRVEPTFSHGNFTRIDRFALHPDPGITSTIKRMDDYKVVLKPNPTFELEYGFYRQFSSAQKAVMAKPYFHKNLPFDGKHAIQGLKPGDIFHFKGRLNMLLDTSYVTDLATISSGLSIGVHYVASGDFEVFIIRLPDDKVQLRVMGSREHRLGASGSVGLDGIKVFGVSFIDGLIEKAVGLEVLSGELEKKFNDGLIIDYVVDLKDHRALTAFDASLLKVREFNYMQVVDPRDSFPEFEGKMLINLSALESERASLNKSIKRLFNTGHEGKTIDKKFSIGNNLIQFNFLSHSSENKFSSDKEGLGQTYVLKTHQSQGSFNLLYSLFSSSSFYKSTWIQEEDQNVPLGVIITSEKTDKNFSQKDLAREKKRLERLLPEVFTLINFSHLENEKLDSVGIRTLVNFTTDAILALPEMSRKEIQKRYKKYLKRFSLGDILSGDISGKGYNNKQRDLELKTSAVAKLLYQMMKENIPLEKKVDALMELNRLKLFKETGIGFLMELLPDDLWKELLYIEVTINSTTGLGISYTSGQKGPIDLYSSLLHYENLMNGNELEFRLLLESLHQQSMLKKVSIK